MSYSPQSSKNEVDVPPILKFDGFVKGLVAASLLASESQQGHFEEQIEKENLAGEWEQ